MVGPADPSMQGAGQALRGARARGGRRVIASWSPRIPVLSFGQWGYYPRAATVCEDVVGVPEFDQIDRYEVLEEIGQGGMSVVYRARDRQLNRDVALKILHGFLARQEDARRRFHREAVAVAKLHHPGIVEIFDYSGPDADRTYIVCELIEGRTLREVIDDEGPIPHPELAAVVTAELIRALRHAHEQGIIHRDLKPENVMVTRNGRLKLMDFGIAQIMGASTRLTATGTLLGSPAHMAPEMIDAQPVDHRSDIFSVGTILYWLATGALPFAGPNPSALFRRILQGAYEPPQAIQPRIGNGLARIIDRSLAVDPDARYQDISELQADLHSELEAVDLLPVEATARAYLARMSPFADELRPKLITKLAEAGRVALDQGNLGRAMDRFNRVLAIDPDHREVNAAVRRVGRQRAIGTRNRRALIAAVSVAGVAGVAAIGIGWYGLRPGRKPAAMGTPLRPIGQLFGQPTLSAPADEPEVGSADTATPTEVTTTEGIETARSPRVRASAEARDRTARLPSDPKKPRNSDSARRVADNAETTPSDGSDPAPSSAERKAEFPLLLRVRRGWADIWLDGRLVAEGAYRTRLRLTPGRHVIEIENQYGRQAPRVVLVGEHGRMVEAIGDSEERPIRGELLLTPPNPPP